MPSWSTSLHAQTCSCNSGGSLHSLLTTFHCCVKMTSLLLCKLSSCLSCRAFLCIIITGVTYYSIRAGKKFTGNFLGTGNHCVQRDAGKDWGQEEKGMTEDEWLDSITDSVDINLSNLWEIVKDREPSMLQFMRSQELNMT